MFFYVETTGTGIASQSCVRTRLLRQPKRRDIQSNELNLGHVPSWQASTKQSGARGWSSCRFALRETTPTHIVGRAIRSTHRFQSPLSDHMRAAPTECREVQESMLSTENGRVSELSLWNERILIFSKYSTSQANLIDSSSRQARVGDVVRGA